jgi:acyl transferase domain-containing protein/phosphopantetheinyl transferase
MVSQARPVVAVVGMAVLLPGAADLARYWRNLREGVDSITTVPPTRWDPSFFDPSAGQVPAAPDRTYCSRGGFVDDDEAVVDLADFGVMPSSVPGIDPDQLIALKVAAAALADAGGPGCYRDPERVGVVFGRGGYVLPATARLGNRIRMTQQLVHTLGELLPDLPAADLERVRTRFADQFGPFPPDAAIGTVPNLVASRVANRLDLRGPAYTVDAACASSLLAVDHAVGELATGRCDVVLAGGVHHCHDVTLWSVFSQLRALSPTQTIRPFDRRADGMLIGEGTGVIVLKRLDDAERDGDRVYAVIRGTGVASDGRAGSLLAPLPAGQTLAVRRAWQIAGLDPGVDGALGLLEAHGTGTPAGDQAELATLRTVFGPPGDEPAVIGSVKSMIGHAMPAAGIAGLIKAALALHHRVLPPTLHCDDPHPDLKLTRFEPIAVARPWAGDGPRRAGVNAFGFGGINAHVVLEEAGHSAAVEPAPRPRVPPESANLEVREPARVLRLSAASPAELIRLLDEDTSSRSGSGSGPVRLGVIDPTAKRIAAARTVVARAAAAVEAGTAMRAWHGARDIWFSGDPLLLAAGAGTAFVFPGLEVEFDPRVEDVARHFGLPLPTLEAGDVGRHALGVVALGRMLDAAVRRLGIVPDQLAGHSIGEWTAMTCAGLQQPAAMDRALAQWDPDALRVPDVEYAVLGCGVRRARQALAGIDQVVISHDNAPNQVMVCGPHGGIADLVAQVRADGVIAQILTFRSGFHTPMFEPFLAPYRTMAQSLVLRAAQVPVWSATTAAVYPAEPAAIRALFLRNLLDPVLFRPLVLAMYEAGVRVFIQLGIGQLPSLIDDILADRPHLAIPALTRQRSGLDQLLRLATALWVEGAEPDLAALAPVKPPARSTARLPVRLTLGSVPISLGPDASSLIAGAPRAVPPPPPAGFARTVRFDTDTMPWLLDHAFVRQRPGWPDLADRRPIVPATVLTGAMMGWAEERRPGGRAVAVRDVRLRRWVAAAPASELTVQAVESGPDTVRVDVGEHCEATVELAATYPAPPAVWAADPTERPSAVQAGTIYEERVMFHGPAFQGIAELLGIGDRSVRGLIAVSATPGALMDNVGQLIGVWIEQQPDPGAALAFPVRVDRISVFGPEPAPGEQVEAVVRIRSFSPELIVADAQVTHRGRLLSTVEGWHDRRFLADPAARAAFRFPERRTQSIRQPGGWVMVADRWSDLPTRELVAGVHLNAAERIAFEHCGPRARRGWLLGRIAVKDAVRQLLWDQESGPVFPAEVMVSNEPSGRPVVTGQHGLRLPPLAVSLAHSGELAVAIARPLRPGAETSPGIDVEQIVERPASTVDVALGTAERQLLAESVALTGDPVARWFTRFWTAKEAVAKAEGTGLLGRPQQFRVVSATTTLLEVVAPNGRRYQVRCGQLDNPPGLPARQYVVAWTTGPTDGPTTANQ